MRSTLTNLFKHAPNFMDFSLRRKLLIVLFVMIIVMVLVMSTTASLVLRSYSRDKIIENAQNLMYQGGQNLTYYFKTLESATLVPYTNSTLYTLLTSKNTTAYTLDSYIDLALNSIASMDSSIYQVHLFCRNVGQHYLLNGSAITKAYLPEDNNFPEDNTFIEGTLSLGSLRMSNNYGVQTLKPSISKPVVTISRTLHEVPQGTYIGEIDIDLDTAYLDSIFNKLRSDELESVYLLGNDGSIVYSSTEGNVEPDYNTWFDRIPSDAESGQFDTVSDAGYIVLYQRISLRSGEFILAKIVPTQTLNIAATLILNLNWFIAAVCLIVGSIVVTIVSYHFTKPIQQLVMHMRSISSGDMKEKISINRKDEIGMLFTYFQSMMDSINDLIYQQYQLEISNKNNQLWALQAQLNPHFINNTIQSIGKAALQSGSIETYDQLSRFGSMMHYCMDFSSTRVPLAEELDYVDHYLGFQIARFEGHFVYSIDLADSIKEVRVPKMLIQPIVENCFKHGHIQNKQNGFVVVLAEDVGQSVSIKITDNGQGTTEETIETLRMQIHGVLCGRSVDDSSHIGIINIAARLELYYGNEASLHINNRPKGGFEVLIELPKEET